MKPLQNSFTTPEQSKRLLELGVPADSADCYFDSTKLGRPAIISLQIERDLVHTRQQFPCWSVGRLMEILKICVVDKEALAEIFEELRDCINEIKSLIKIFDEYSDVLDFSKLEE